MAERIGSAPRNRHFLRIGSAGPTVSTVISFSSKEEAFAHALGLYMSNTDPTMWIVYFPLNTSMGVHWLNSGEWTPTAQPPR